MKRKAFLQGDLIFWMVMIFTLSIVIIVVYMGLSNLNTPIQADANIPQESKNLLNTVTTRFKSNMDWFIVTLLIGIFIAIILSALFLKTHPALVGVSILVMIIILGVVLRMSNAFYSFSSADGITQTASQFSVIPVVMNNLPKLIVFLIIAYIVILYAKRGQGSPF